MNHPPTGCDRSLFLDEHGKPLAITNGDIAKAVSWYERSWVRINEALPVVVGGTIYQPRWQDIMDRQTLPAYRENRLSHSQAVAYVYWALKRLYGALHERDRADP